MTATVVGALAALSAGAGGLALWRANDRRLDRRAWDALLASAGPPAGSFDPTGVRDVPTAARRYFAAVIEPGAALPRVVVLRLTGEIGLGSKRDPRYRSFRARQILAPPFGLVWQVRAGSIAGSDGATPTVSWSRFWLWGLIPVARRAHDGDHDRSAFGRVVAEAAFWAPASLLPGPFVRWVDGGPDVARAVVRHRGLEQAVDIALAPDGTPTRVTIDRWSAENSARVWRRQPFGGDLSEFRRFAGQRLPTQVVGGNHIGTDDYVPFYRARVTDVSFPSREAADEG